MENASRALLISAAVLIVILLIAFGMKIYNSAGTGAEDAEAVGEAISSKTIDPKVKAILSMMDIEDDKYFNNYLRKNYGNKTLSAKQVEEVIKLVMYRNQDLTGEAHSTTRTYISRWQRDASGGADVWWRNSIDRTLERIDKEKKYIITLAEKEGYEVYSVMITYAD